MSAEVATASVLWKPILWVFGGLLALIKLFIAYIWYAHKDDVKSIKSEVEETKKKNSAQDARVTKLELDLTKNYYDKDEITKHIVEPIKEGQRDTNATLKLFTSHIGEMQQDMAILKYTLLGQVMEDQRDERKNKKGV